MSVRAGTIVERKGNDVVTIEPEAPLHQAAALMAEHDIGALLVSASGGSVDGMISERDIVRCVTRLGPGCMEQPVSEVMTGEVTTCPPSASADHLMKVMTDSRIRHVPVVDDGRLVGIVSIGDVVKSRLDELQVEKDSLEQYVTGTH